MNEQAVLEIASPPPERLVSGPPEGGIRFVCTFDPDGDLQSFEEHDSHSGSLMRTPEGLEPDEHLIHRVAARSGDHAPDVQAARDFLEARRRRADGRRRYETLVGRLVAKMRLSQTPVPGFIVGLSGTDSILCFLVVAEAARRMGLGDRVLGIHYASSRRRKPTWFEEHIVPWLREARPQATILVEEPLGGNHDQQRWADLHLRALNEVSGDETGNLVVRPLPAGRNYWTVGCINSTEQDLGKFSAMSREVSVAPIRKVRKSKVIRMCEALDVPAIAVEYSRLPDCLCGRDDVAANNIELIDAILDHEVRVREHDPDLLDMMFAYVRDLKHENGFKQRTPYLL